MPVMRYAYAEKRNSGLGLESRPVAAEMTKIDKNTSPVGDGLCTADVSHSNTASSEISIIDVSAIARIPIEIRNCVLEENKPAKLAMTIKIIAEEPVRLSRKSRYWPVKLLHLIELTMNPLVV